ncbi:MAG: hypothetical protein ACE5KS_03990 [Woeseiaceae bacterium]
MRTFIILGMFTASLASADWRDYEETRDLTLDAAGVNTVEITAGAGSLDVQGSPGAGEISVTARIRVPGEKEEKARKIIESDLVLTLERDGDKAVLKGYFDSKGFGWDDSPSVRLEVAVPQSIGLEIDDGSGSTVIRDVAGDIEVEDGSGSLQMTNVGGTVRIEDGSGSISVEGVGDDISINDGSGSITVSNVRGSVVVDDGSGSINVSDVEADLIIEDDGSGSLNFARIDGRVEKKD